MNTALLDEVLEALAGKGKEKIANLIYPRRILPPLGYVNPKYYAATLFSSLATQSAVGPDQKRDTSVMLTIARLTEMKMPTFFLAEDFIRAVAATEPPAETTLKDLHWPLESMLFVLPTSFYRSYTGYETPFLAITHAGVATYSMGRYQIVSEADRVVVHYPLVIEDGSVIDYTGAYKLERHIHEIEEAPFTDYSLLAKPTPGVALPGPEEEQKLNQKLNALAVKILLVLNARPELTEYGSVAREEKRNKKGELEKERLWHPNIIGKKYQVQRGAGDGSHASPDAHWRRGHMRNQVCGKGRLQRKLIWIDPVLVNL